MIDYGALPPEINSGRMYAGAGSGPMLAAAAAWDALADELALTAAALETTIIDLQGPWRGPAAMSMAAAGLPFAAWFKATAAQAEQTASQAKAAAAAYHTAFSMHVHPAVIAANRAQLMVLIATNFFGQNTPAIAATEAHYTTMWAQDAAAMYGYLGSSSAARQLSEFSMPPRTTAQQQTTAERQAGDPAGPAGLPSLAAQSVGSAPVTSTAPVTGTSASTITAVQPLVNQLTTFTTLANSALGPQRLLDATGQGLNGWEDAPNGYGGARDVLAGMAKAAEGAAKGVGTASLPTPASGANLPTAGLAKAVRVGGLSVPQSWPGLPGAANPAGATLVSSRLAGSAAPAEGLPRAGFGVPGLPGASATGGAGGFRFVPRYGYRHKVMNRPTSVG